MTQANNNTEKKKEINFVILKGGKVYHAKSLQELCDILPDNFYMSDETRIPIPKEITTKIKDIERYTQQS